MYSFNLIDQPWIPCVTLAGEPVELSLRDLLARAHTLRAIHAETPLMTTALLPLTLALLHRVFGPRDSRAWQKLYQAGAFSMPPLEDYFAAWSARFDLFHPERPFYQMRDERVEPKSLVHLIHSAGNTGTLFTHMNEEQGLRLTAAQAARHLVTAQVFRTAGLSGLAEKFTDSIYTRGVLFWASGATVFETLVLNLLPYPAEMIGIRCTADDRPAWEQENAGHQRAYPYGYLDYLTWQNNRVLLLPQSADGQLVVEAMTIAPGLHIAPDILSPQRRYTFKEDKKAWQFMYFNPDKALWRDYHALLTLNSEQQERPPRIVLWLHYLAGTSLEPDAHFTLMAAGMLADQAKPIFYREEYLPLPAHILGHERRLPLVARAIQQAEEAGKSLREALNTLAEQVLMRGGDQAPDKKVRDHLVDQWDLLAWYWMQLEPGFWNLVDELARDVPEAGSTWHAVLKQVAHDALQMAAQMSGTSAWALRGRVAAERRLHIGLSKLDQS
ncbi:MAG: type I-E CRISPR-associated protein Cse1/CasA [Anaerolineae bacterium]|nr:type I-E CRISPR-associated protein Cse1/CasA [Anaerolineae bacterium]